MHTFLAIAALVANVVPSLALPTVNQKNALSVRQADINVNLPSIELGMSNKQRYFGTATEAAELNQTPQLNTIVQADFGVMTPEYTMKWATTEPTQGAFNFELADALVAYAQQNNKRIRCHTLIWHIDLPGWVYAINDAAQLTAVMQNHISTVMGHFKGTGKCMHWDVVNEIFNDDGTLRQNHFMSVIGEDYVRLAFEAARQADPNAKLFLNDYSLQNAGWAKVTQGVVPYVTKWISQGIPIDGIGSQCHLNAGDGPAVPASLQALAAIPGLSEVAVTELDIAGASPTDFVPVVQGCADEPKCVGVTTWGVSDATSWRAPASVLLFDDSYVAKPAYTAITSQVLGL